MGYDPVDEELQMVREVLESKRRLLKKLQLEVSALEKHEAVVYVSTWTKRSEK